MKANLSASALRGMIAVDLRGVFGDSDKFEILFLEKVLSGDPNHIDAMTVLAHLYSQKGLYEKGLALDRKLSFLDPSNPITFYNLACSYALLDRTDEAIAALQEAVRIGFRDWKLMESDPDLATLRSVPRFRAIWDRLKADS